MNKQSFYVLPNSDGFLTTISSEKQTDKSWQQVTVDQSHLVGFGKWFYTIRLAKDGTLQYPDNWPTDQSNQIKAMQNQINSYSQAIHKSNQNTQRLTQMVSFLQMQLAQNQKGGNK